MTSKSGSSNSSNSNSRNAPTPATPSRSLQLKRGVDPAIANQFPESSSSGSGGSSGFGRTAPTVQPLSAAPVGAFVGQATRSSPDVSSNAPTDTSSWGSGGSSIASGKTVGGAVDTTVNQQPAAKPSTEGPESTVVTSGPRSDFSVVLASQVGNRPSRSPARSNNFISLASGAGSLGRKNEAAKRSLIGGV